MGTPKAYILQDSSGQILAVETNLKKLASNHGDRYKLLSYQHMQRLTKKAKDDGGSEITINGKDGNDYTISWWKL